MVCKGAFFALRNLSRIRRYLNSNAAKMLVHSFVSAKLDYGNILLLGSTEETSEKTTTGFAFCSEDCCTSCTVRFHNTGSPRFALVACEAEDRI